MTRKKKRNNKEKIVLYSPRVEPTLRGISTALPLLSIASIPHNQGYDVKIFSWEPEIDLERTVVKESRDALCVGISVMTGYQITDGLRAAKLIKQRNPKIPIVWGGWHPSLLPRQTLENPFVDIVVKGQGERTFAELAKALSWGKELSGIKGLVYKEDGKIFENEERFPEDINNFPPMPYKLLNIEKYIWNYKDIGNRTIHYVTSYGCPHRCAFCCHMSVTKRKWSGLTAERVLDDVERLVKDYGVNGLALVDSNFFVDKERVRKICQGVVDRGLKVRWAELDGRTKQLADFDDELWRLMEKAGFRTFLVGSESGSQESLDFINKDVLAEDTLRLAEKCRKHNVKVLFSNLAGLPWDHGLTSGERKRKIDKEIKATVEMIDKLYAIDNRHRFSLFTYLPYPGTPFYEKALELGFKPPLTLEGWGNFHFYNKRTPWVTKKQERLMTMLSSYIFWFLGPYCETIPSVIASSPLRFLTRILLKSFQTMARLRWRYKYFESPLDYWLFWFIKRHQPYF